MLDAPRGCVQVSSRRVRCVSLLPSARPVLRPDDRRQQQHGTCCATCCTARCAAQRHKGSRSICGTLCTAPADMSAAWCITRRQLLTSRSCLPCGLRVRGPAPQAANTQARPPGMVRHPAPILAAKRTAAARAQAPRAQSADSGSAAGAHQRRCWRRTCKSPHHLAPSSGSAAAPDRSSERVGAHSNHMCLQRRRACMTASTRASPGGCPSPACSRARPGAASAARRRLQRPTVPAA